VDAIDFLLTGRISRLTGKGTGGITLSQHGPHIDHQPKDALVRALIQVPGLKETVEIQRCMANPDKLIFDESKAECLDPVLLLARRGQHVLTRRDILRFITAESGTRAQQIQELLNISEIETTRKMLVTIQNDFEKELEAEQAAVDRAKGDVNATVQVQTFSESTVLQFVNQNRTLLGGQPISTLGSQELKGGLKAPRAVSGEQKFDVTLLEGDIQNLCNVTSSQSKKEISRIDKELRGLIVNIRSDPGLLRSLSRLRLTELGMTLIDETGSCPLCDTAWPPGKLRGYLEKRLSTVRSAARQLRKVSETLAVSVNGTLSSLAKVIELANNLGLKPEFSLLESWSKDLEALLSALGDVISKYPDMRFPSKDVQQMLAPDKITETLTRIRTLAKEKYPELTREQIAWDSLTRLEVNLGSLEGAETRFKNAKLAHKKASLLHSSFVFARDTVLGQLYDSIGNRFVDLYRRLHGLDEGNFTAKIEPEEAGLNFEVDFYGRGTHPPHALHSEGHQDSMGICLYLALSEHLTKGVIDLVILDDVVMSVDADHRRAVCNVLRTCFPNRQFLITTHDRTWANQLKSAGIVDKGGMVEFWNWHVETGPLVTYEIDIWERIEEEIRKNNIADAAARLRRGSEQFFSEVCDALEAHVTYKLNAQWELGDFLPAAMERYRELLKLAKSAANSWGDKATLEMLNELDSTRAQIYKRSGAEQWTINANVHYNNWSNFLEQDFRPVVDAFRDLHGLFLCSSCGGMLRIATSGIKPVNVRCDCGKINWNLIEKDKTN